MTTTNTAHARMARLLAQANNPEVIDQVSRVYYGHTILVATVVGDPSSDGEEYYADETYLSWDAGLDRPGDAGACTVASSALATWLSLMWPCTTKSAGYARDGQWYSDGFAAIGR